MQNKKGLLKVLTLCYFIMAFFEITSEYTISKSLILIFKPLLTCVLIVIYLIDSNKRNWFFVSALFLSLITNVLFIPNIPSYLFYAIIVFTIHRFISIYIILRMQQIKDYFPTLIGTIPFLLIFFYLFAETPDIPENSFYLLIVQNVLISLFAGIALASYIMDDNKQNSILLIAALLFVMLQFVIFIEKYFLTNEYQQLFRPLAMTLNILAFYSFYKYVITAEKKLNHND